MYTSQRSCSPNDKGGAGQNRCGMYMSEVPVENHIVIASERALICWRSYTTRETPGDYIFMCGKGNEERNITKLCGNASKRYERKQETSTVPG